jgi:hypothetical protein
MRYKVINNNSSYQKSRADYLYEKFCIDKELNPKTFVHEVKHAYYRYDSAVYSPSHLKTHSSVFQSLFSSLTFKKSPVIIDIGAGGGQSYELVKSIDFEFEKYYFIEPFQSMIDQFDDKDDDKVVLVCDYFETAACSDLLRKETRPKIFMMCSSLRTLDNLSEFIEFLKEHMSVNDKFVLPLEPNNEYFGRYYKVLVPLILVARILKKAQSFISFKKSYSTDTSHEKHPLDLSLEFLKQKGICNNNFTIGMLYAIVYYNNFFTWRKIKVPEKYNDGFFTIEHIADQLGGRVTKFKTDTYLYGFSFGNKKIDDYVEKVLNKIFPKSGAVLSAVITKL